MSAPDPAAPAKDVRVFETIGCALATLRRLDRVWYDVDNDVRDEVTRARAALSIAQTKTKERIDE